MPRVLQFGLSSNLVIYLYGCNAFSSEEESNFYNFQKQRSFLFNGKMLVSINPNCFLPPKKKKNPNCATSCTTTIHLCSSSS